MDIGARSSGADRRAIFLGKTTFANGSPSSYASTPSPVTISLDNYFVSREATPLDEHGKPDFENIETVDLPLSTNS